MEQNSCSWDGGHAQLLKSDGTLASFPPRAEAEAEARSDRSISEASCQLSVTVSTPSLPLGDNERMKQRLKGAGCKQ